MGAVFRAGIFHDDVFKPVGKRPCQGFFCKGNKVFRSAKVGVVRLGDGGTGYKEYRKEENGYVFNGYFHRLPLLQDGKAIMNITIIKNRKSFFITYSFDGYYTI
jgi:hypothetical protein